MVYLFYTTIISVDHAHHEIFRAKVGKGGINQENAHTRVCDMENYAMHMHLFLESLDPAPQM